MKFKVFFKINDLGIKRDVHITYNADCEKEAKKLAREWVKKTYRGCSNIRHMLTLEI